MRTRHLVAVAATVTLAVGALPAAADPPYSTFESARTILRTAGRSVHSVCAAVRQADALLDRIAALGTTADCPAQAYELTQVIEDALPMPSVPYPAYVVVLKAPAKLPKLSTSEIAPAEVIAYAKAQTNVTSTPDGAAFAAWQQGAQVQYVYRHALRGYAARMSPSTLAAVSADPNVDYVEQEQWYEPAGQQPNPPWGLDRIDQRTLPLDNWYYHNPTGAGVKAYVIDSGINYGHTDFGGRAVPGTDFVTPSLNGDDCMGHGSHVAGTLGGSTYGVAKAVSLVSVRVFGCNTGASTPTMIAAVDWVTNDHLPGQRAVANMSVQGPGSAAYDTAVNNSINDGIVYSVAAGNSNADACNYTPARVPAAITNGATSSNDQRWPSSNWGTCVDWFAPGDLIPSAWWGSPTATNTISGTSMATPHTSGVAALYLEAYPTATPSQVTSGIQGWLTQNVVGNPNGSTPHLLHVATQLHIPAIGTITITKNGGPATMSTTGVFATSEYSCGLSTSPIVEATCVTGYDPDLVWECVRFILTAEAGMNGIGAGQVSGRVSCDSGQVLGTNDVNGTGTQVGDNLVTGEQLGTAYVVRCRAAGINGGPNPTGSYRVTCNEPGVRYPYE